MTEGLSGNFDYASLKATLKDEGLNRLQISSALRKIESDNNIDDIKELDRSQEIEIAGSIFDNAVQSQVVTDTVEDTTDIMAPIINQNIMGDGDSLMNLPEIYNDDEYEVVEYDDFYGFAEDTNETEETEETDEETGSDDEIDFETFEEKYGNSFATQTIDMNKEEALKKIFGMADADSSETLDKEELNAALYGSLFTEQKYKEGADDIQPGEEDLLGNGMMDMDMSNDSFNPQG